MAKYYLVGGAVRDSFLGQKSKDVDYAVEAESFEAMRQDILERGGKIFLEKPEFFTIRARFGKDTSDYVLCRKDGVYKDGRHPDKVEKGTILDDLARRDFTMNAIAIEVGTNKVIDPFEGEKDIKRKLIRCVGETDKRFDEDALRMLRAIRFSITLDMAISNEIHIYIAMNAEKLRQISQERIREELTKCFAYDTVQTLEKLTHFPEVAKVVFGNGLWLKPTLEAK